MPALRLLTSAVLVIGTLFLPPGGLAQQRVEVSATGTEIIFPVAGRGSGAAGTLWETDLRILDILDLYAEIPPVDVTLEFYPAGENVTGQPAHSRQIRIPITEQLMLNGWASIFPEAGDGFGAIRLTADRRVVAVARVYNDLGADGGGTYGQFVGGSTAEDARLMGILPMLSSQLPPAGLRTNIGWFNNSANAVRVTFRAHLSRGAPGSRVFSTTLTIPPYGQMQVPLVDLFPGIEPDDNVFVSFFALSAIHVYASVVDNATGDPIFIPAQ
jgi:hypothetical protein